MRVHNSQVLALRTVPRGVRSVEIELFVSDAERGADLVFEVARIVPRGPTQFVRVPAVTDVEELDPELVRIRLRAAVPPGREWLAESLFGAIARERAPEGLILHGPVVTIVDEQATTESMGDEGALVTRVEPRAAGRPGQPASPIGRRGAGAPGERGLTTHACGSSHPPGATPG
jgi:hypothetical protein